MKKLIKSTFIFSLVFAFSLALLGCEAPEPVPEVPSVPDKVYSGEGFSFSYPGEYTADGQGIWTEEGYGQHIYPPKECSTCQIPYIEVKSEITDKSLEEYIVADFTFGDSTLEQMAENNFVSYENTTIGANDFIKIRVNENFAVTGYYAKNGSQIVALRVYFDDRDNDELLKMVETLIVEVPTEVIEEDTNEIPFASCGDADKYSGKNWFFSFSEQIKDIENIQVMCLSKDGFLAIVIYNQASYCSRGKIYRYYTQDDSLQEADILGEVHDCSAGFYDIGKREANIIPVYASTGDAGCSFETTFDYDYIKNTVKLVKGCSKCVEIIDDNEVVGPEKCIDL